MNEPKYDAAYFLAKFEAIPDELWCIGRFTIGERHCAQGHCGKELGNDNTPENAALRWVMKTGVVDVNDGTNPRYQQPTIKGRIMAALRDAKEAGR